MEPRELNLRELQEISGGSDTSTNNFNVSTGTNAMLSLDYEWRQGDKSYQWKLEVGKDVHANLGLFNERKG